MNQNIYRDLINEVDLANYLKKLHNLDNVLVIIAVCDTITPSPDVTNIGADAYHALEQLGFHELGHGATREFWSAYIGIIYNGSAIYEQLAPRNNSLFTEMDLDGINVKVISAPYRSFNVASIKINNQEFALNQRGLNIAVFDPVAEQIIDAVAFDTWDKAIPASRRQKNVASQTLVKQSGYCKYLNLDKYIKNITSLSDYLIILALKDTISTPCAGQESVKDHKLTETGDSEVNGFINSQKNKFGVGYIGIFYKRKAIFQKLGEYGKTISYENNIDGMDLRIVSSPYICDNKVSINLNGMEYAVNERGINIVIFDPNTGRLVDSVAFDTWQKNAPCQRNFFAHFKNTDGKIELETTAPREEVRRKIDILYSDITFYKVKTIIALLRDYNITHIVLSAGTRHAPLVRMFENNQDQFTLYSVVDERSAGYFAMGLSVTLKEPVVCVCTSGTAASNYLPPVTEAFYTGIPLIIITTDRMGFLLNHGEDQTIPQKNIYNGVIKKSVTLPEGNREIDRYQTRRDITECILECTHHTPGPVHINYAVENPWIGADVPGEYWNLKNIQPEPVEPHIDRVEVDNDHQDLRACLNQLEKARRILLVYGQNPPPTQRQLANIEAFSAKFNCVILTDLISNLYASHTLQTYNMLRQITQHEFDEKFAPEILIGVGGKRLMNDPLTEMIRRSQLPIQYWLVSPDGKVKDFYFKLSKILECSQDYFFDWFSAHANNTANDDNYYMIWKNASESHLPPVREIFDSHYIQRKFIPAIPCQSLLHLGVGLSFHDTRRYTIDPTVAVYCNMGTNGIDGCTSTFMGSCAVERKRLCFLLVGDLSFFYDMNSLWNKKLNKNIRILLVNNNGSDLLRYIKLDNITCVHNTTAKEWAEATGFEYIGARTMEEFDDKLRYFVSDKPEKAVFLEAMYNF